jgi:hypothetical protein
MQDELSQLSEKKDKTFPVKSAQYISHGKETILQIHIQIEGYFGIYSDASIPQGPILEIQEELTGLVEIFDEYCKPETFYFDAQHLEASPGDMKSSEKNNEIYQIYDVPSSPPKKYSYSKSVTPSIKAFTPTDPKKEKVIEEFNSILALIDRKKDPSIRDELYTNLLGKILRVREALVGAQETPVQPKANYFESIHHHLKDIDYGKVNIFFIEMNKI